MAHFVLGRNIWKAAKAAELKELLPLDSPCARGTPEMLCPG